MRESIGGLVRVRSRRTAPAGVGRREAAATARSPKRVIPARHRLSHSQVAAKPAIPGEQHPDRAWLPPLLAIPADAITLFRQARVGQSDAATRFSAGHREQDGW